MDIIKVVYLTVTAIIAWIVVGKLIDKWEDKHGRD